MVLSPGELVDDPHAQAVGLFVDSQHPVLGSIRQPRPPVRFEKTPASLGGPAPTVGQQTDEILEEIGLGPQIARLREAGVVA